MANTAESFKFEDRNQVITSRRRHFETIFVLSPAMEDKAVEDFVEKNVQLVGNTDGTLLRQDDWGKLKMAYEMEKHAQGRFFYFRYIGSAATVKALERSLKLFADCMRFQTVRLSENLSENEINDLMQRAPREPGVSPTAQSEENFEYMS